jgi:acyl carrier protein
MNTMIITEESLAGNLDAFIRERFRVPKDDDRFHPDTNVWEEGYVDSAGVVEVFAFIESTIGDRLPDTLLFDPEFVTVRGMARLVVASLQ